MTDIKDKYLATMMLHALGDTIGFKNGDWEFKYNKQIITPAVTLELLYEFIALGGINGINLDNWRVSDDTLFHMAIAYDLIDSKKLDDSLILEIKSSFEGVTHHMLLDKEKGIKRYIGLKTLSAIEKFKDNKDERTEPYDEKSGGNGCAMRTACIGLALYGKENRDKLIYVAIESSRLTHNSPIGYLGGLVTALFTAFALEKIHIYSWVPYMLEIIESDKVKKYLRKEYPQELNDYDEFVTYWNKYYDIRFDNKKPIETRANTNLIFRGTFYYDNFTQGTRGYIIGDSGFSSVIMAYDCLIDCDGKWEKLIIYSALHWGDTDTVASIAGALYGAVYGFGDVPESNLKYLEYKDILKDLAEKLFKKYK